MPLISNPQDITLMEEDDVQQILGHTPGWMLQWGSLLIALGFAFILFVAAYVHYPEIVSAPVLLTTEQPPIAVVARTNGKIGELHVAEKQIIEAGMTLAVLENTAKTQDVLALSLFLKKIEQLSSPVEISDIDLPEYLQLGELQNKYASFTLQYSDLTYFLNRNQLAQSIRSLKRQIQEIKKLNQTLDKQKETLKQVHELAILKSERYRTLRKDDRLVSSDQVEAADIAMLQSKRQLELLDSEMIRNELQIQKIEESILNLKQNDQNSYSDKWLGLLEIIQSLNSDIALWKEKYLLIAPISGQVTLPNIQNENQFVKMLEEVMYITPTENSGRIFGKANLPIPRAGKVEIGQDVKIRLLDYPYQEYGVVKGKIQDIALVPMTDQNGNANYYVEIDLSEGLTTTYGDSTLGFRQGMQGQAQIITQDQSVLGSLFNKIWSQIKN